MHAHPHILVFGGTFDPPHVAHAVLPPFVARQIGCGRILYVPAAVSPHKLDTPPTPDHHRIAMLLLALADVPEAQISSVELERGGPSYTVDTLRTLRGQYGADVTLRLLIGADQALAFHRWKDWEEILDLATPVVLMRPPLDRERFGAALHAAYDVDEAERWMAWTVDAPALDVSATEIRAALAEGRDDVEGLAPAVLDYIRRHRLYRPTADSTA